jgi:hypothetical protein
MRGSTILRYGLFLLTVLLLGGCSLTVENPRSGEVVACSQGVADLSPWSQRESCAAEHLAQGWTLGERQ